MLGDQAASNAPLVSKLTIIKQLVFWFVSRINPLASSVVSTAIFWGKNPYWFPFRGLLEKAWWLILSISSFSLTSPPTINRIIGRYFVSSVQRSFPVLNMGMVIERLHCLGSILSLGTRWISLSRKWKSAWKSSKVFHCSSRPLPVFCWDQTFLTPPVFPTLWILRHRVCQEVLLPVVWWNYDVYCRYTHCLRVWNIPSCVSLCSLCPSYKFRFGFWELIM